MERIIAELQSRWEDMYCALERGEDVAPARGLRAEGMMEAAVLAGIATPAELDRLLEDCCRRCTGRTLAESLGDDWRRFHPFPELPLWMRRAPVYPSTAN